MGICKIDEILQDLQTNLLTLLGMELHAKYVLFFNYGDDWLTITASGYLVLLVLTSERKTVYKVEGWICRKIL